MAVVIRSGSGRGELSARYSVRAHLDTAARDLKRLVGPAGGS
ncbi:hypothetical protein NVV99_18690 [Rhodococcus sp. PAE-6]|nr:hypothetical protein [Rhodococcus sp. PAE-6]MCT7292961.1 hypothetical protein [Rhodococcus sp. PAE-6]